MFTRIIAATLLLLTASVGILLTLLVVLAAAVGQDIPASVCMLTLGFGFATPTCIRRLVDLFDAHGEAFRDH